jgi:hypothetical protein
MSGYTGLARAVALPLRLEFYLVQLWLAFDVLPLLPHRAPETLEKTCKSFFEIFHAVYAE